MKKVLSIILVLILSMSFLPAPSYAGISDDVIDTESEPISINSEDIEIEDFNAQYTFNGKARKQPDLYLFNYDLWEELFENDDYVVSYKNNVKVGIAQAIITGIGNYTGSRILKYKIVPKGTKVSKLNAGVKKIKVKWKRQTTQTSGYQVQYSTSSKFKSGTHTKTIKSKKKNAVTLKSLKGGRKYYVRIRTFKNVSGKKYYSNWSKAKSIKTKKKAAAPTGSRSGSSSGGSSSGSRGSANTGGSGGGIVYWTPSGSVYHSTPNCPTLSRSRIIMHGTIAQSGKARGCKVCH